MGKLVRDRIPEIIERSGRQPKMVVLTEEEYAAALLAKLQEEVDELVAAPAEGRLEEAGDVYEVLLAIAAELGHSEADLHREARLKREARGAFIQRLWLED
jgi:predicted house-cleaning noncanonical NTP pyrophosphatase (MazG superfamily)